MTFKHKLSARLALLKNALIVVALAAVACEKPVALTEPDPTTSLHISPKFVTLPTNGTSQLMAVALTASGDTANLAVSWSVTGGAIMDTSTSSGRHYGRYKAGADTGKFKVVARGNGQNTSTADTATITVIPPPVASVAVTPANVSILVGASVQLAAVAKDSAGTVLSGRTTTWASNASSVAYVNSTGLVTSAAAGSATITATSEGKSGSSTVTVTSTPAPVASVQVTPASASVPVGQTVQLTATPRDANGTALGGRAVAWTSDNATVAGVNPSGLVTGAAVGSATITATSEGQSGSSSITVTSAPVPVASVSVTPPSAGIQVGQTVQLTATPRDASGGALTGRTVTWGSSNTSVAAVNGSGLVAGAAAGSATITATSEGKNGTSTITVTTPPPAPVASVTVGPSAASIVTGRTLQLVAVPRDASGNVLSGRTVTWSSASAPVASVNGSGLVSGVTVGAATITATSEGQNGTSAITVVAPPPGGVATCLDQVGPLLTFSGSQSSNYANTSMAANTKADARTASWVGVGDTPVRVGGSAICWSGGLVLGTYSASTSWDVMHGAYGILVYSAPNAIIDNVRIHDYGDGISFNNSGSDNWLIRGVHISISRDDCIENDFGNSGLIEDNLFDGCYVGYSSRSYSTVSDNSSKVVTVRNTLWRLVDMPTGYTGPGHGKFWKMDSGRIDPLLALHDNIFRMDTPPACCGDYLIPPPDRLASCSNNIIVWLGSGAFPEPVPACFTLTTDKSVWDNAVAAWRTRHPDNAQEFPFP